jgi:hypothetical protein
MDNEGTALGSQQPSGNRDTVWRNLTRLSVGKNAVVV